MEENILKKYITFLKINRTASKKTIDIYTRDISHFCKFLQIDINNLKRLKCVDNDDIKKWLIERKSNVTNRTISRQIVSIKMFFIFLKDVFNIQNDNILNMNGLKFNACLPKAINRNCLVDIIDNLQLVNTYDFSFENSRDKLLLVLLFCTGMRVSEVSDLKHEDMTKNELIIMGKGKKERIVPLIDSIKKYYHEYKEDLDKNCIKYEYNSCLFIKIATKNKKIKKMSIRDIGRVFENIKKYYNLQTFSPHTMRHSFATTLLENGANIKQIQTLLGHENLGTTQKYTKITSKLLEKKLLGVKW